MIAIKIIGSEVLASVLVIILPRWNKWNINIFHTEHEILSSKYKISLQIILITTFASVSVQYKSKTGSACFSLTILLIW